MNIGKILIVIGTVLALIGLFLTAFVHAVPLRTDLIFTAGGASGIGLGLLLP